MATLEEDREALSGAAAVIAVLFSRGLALGVDLAELAAVVAFSTMADLGIEDAAINLGLTLDLMATPDAVDVAEWRARGVTLGADALARDGFAALYTAITHAADDEDAGDVDGDDAVTVN